MSYFETEPVQLPAEQNKAEVIDLTLDSDSEKEEEANEDDDDVDEG